MKLRVLAVMAIGIPALAADVDPDDDAKTRRISLRECVHLALAQGLEIEIARYQPWIDDQAVVASLGSFDHVLYSSLTQNGSVSGASSVLSGAPELRSDAVSTKVGVRQLLPMGLTYDLYFQNDRSHTNSSFALIDPMWNQSVGVAVTLPLLKGRGEESAYAGVVLARETREISSAAFHESLVRQVRAIHEAYWALVFAIEQKRVRDQSLEVAARLLDETKKKFERGLVAAVDVTEAESGVAGQQEGILTAENAIQDAMDRLKRLIDPSMLRGDLSLVPADAPSAPAALLDEKAATQAAVAEAVRTRPEVRRLGHQVAAQEALLVKAEADRRPKLDFTGGGAFTGLDDRFQRANKELGKGDTYGWSVGIVFELPLEGRATAGAEQKADLELRRLWLQRQNLENQILVEIREAVRAVKTTEKRIEATRKAEGLATAQRDGEMNRRDQGLRTTFHVLEAERRLTEARTNAVKAAIDYQLALQQLYLAGGTILERNGVVLEEQLGPRLASKP